MGDQLCFLLSVPSCKCWETCTSEESMRGEALGKKMIIYMANYVKTTIVAISEWADLADSRMTVTGRRIVFTSAMCSLVLDM